MFLIRQNHTEKQEFYITRVLQNYFHKGKILGTA